MVDYSLLTKTYLLKILEIHIHLNFQGEVSLDSLDNMQNECSFFRKKKLFRKKYPKKVVVLTGWEYCNSIFDKFTEGELG